MGKNAFSSRRSSLLNEDSGSKEAKNKMSGKLRMSEGDWICDQTDCQNVNFARRMRCNKCGTEKSLSERKRKKNGNEVGEKFAEKSHGLFSALDWQCNKCGNVNWARRSTCNVCNAPKVGPDEIRTGYGGGFKENADVSYKEKEDSDGEYDEFGRKKKHLRGQVPIVTSLIDTTDQPSDKGDDYDDDDDDDDDGVDISQYDLSDDDDDDDNSPATSPKSLKRRGEDVEEKPKRRRSSSSSSSSSQEDKRPKSSGKK